MVKNVTIDSSVVDLTVELATPACPLKATIESDIGDALARSGRASFASTGRATSSAASGGPAADLMPGVKNTIAVASGKGGVGKSTVAVNLAVAWRATVPGRAARRRHLRPQRAAHDGHPGRRTSPARRRGRYPVDQPRRADDDRSGTSSRPSSPSSGAGRSSTARSPRSCATCGASSTTSSSTFRPAPGTPRSRSTQLIPLTGAVIVTTPQEVSLLDAGRRRSAMFNEVRRPTLGVIENMSGFVCPHCSEEHDIFGSGGGAKIARELELEVLGRIPLEPGVRAGGDAGVPITSAQYPGGEASVAAAALREVARVVAGKVSVLAAPVAVGSGSI